MKPERFKEIKRIYERFENEFCDNVMTPAQLARVGTKDSKTELIGCLRECLDDLDRLHVKETEWDRVSAETLGHLKIIDLNMKILEHHKKKLEKFKAYVHARLDQAGIPHDPEPEKNKQHGCRIKGRLNYLINVAKGLFP